MSWFDRYLDQPRFCRGRAFSGEYTVLEYRVRAPARLREVGRYASERERENALAALSSDGAGK